jgi:hypothetical protein
MSKSSSYYPDPLPYKKAPDGSPDKFVTTDCVLFRWFKAPSKLLKRVLENGIPIGAHGIMIHGRTPEGQSVLVLQIEDPFYFAVSVAPSFRRSLAAALLHDFIYAHAEKIAMAWGISVRDVLHIADLWFYAQMSASGFLLKRTYFIAVRLFGYYFHKLCGNTSQMCRSAICSIRGE